MTGDPRTPAPSCADDSDPNSLTVEAALARMAAAVPAPVGTEQVALRAALGRVLAEEILSPVNVPSHTNSAMDGYAVRGTDLPASGETTLAVVGTAYARITSYNVCYTKLLRVALQRPLDRTRSIIVILAYNQRIQLAAGGIQRIHSRIDAELRDLARQHQGGVEVGEGCRG